MEFPQTFVNEGQQLVGMVHRPEGPGPFPAVILLHGFMGCKSDTHRILVKMSRRLAAAGILAFRFDFRGSGDSEGDFVDATLAGEVADAEAALDWLRNRPDVDVQHLGLLGLSMGGAVAALLAGREPGLQAVALWSAVADVLPVLVDQDATGDGASTIYEQGWLDVKGWQVGLDFVLNSVHHQPASAIQDYKGALLVVHGTADEVVPFDHARRLAAAASKANVQRLVVDGADHTYARHDWEQQVLVRTASFFQAHLL